MTGDPPSAPRSSGALTALYATAAFVIVVAGMRAAAPLLVPCFLAIFVSVLSTPPLNALRRRGCPTWLALLVVVTVLIVAGTGIGAVITGAVREFNSKSQHYQARVGDIRDDTLTWVAGFFPEDEPADDNAEDADRPDASSADPASSGVGDEGDAADGNPEVSGAPEPAGVDSAVEGESPDGGGEASDAEKPRAAFTFSWANVRRALESFDLSAMFQQLSTILEQLSGLLGNALFIVLTVIFILAEASGFPAKIRHAFSRSSDVQAVLDRFAHSIHQYMMIKTVMSLITGGAIGIWLYLLNVDFPLLWALLAFFLNFIPNLGSILAAAPAVLLAWVQLGGTTAGAAAAGYLVANFAVGNVLEPRFMGKGLDLSTLVVFVSLVFWGWVFGPVGMLLSVPLTMLIKIGLEASPETRWVAVLLGSGPPADGEETAPAATG